MPLRFKLVFLLVLISHSIFSQVNDPLPEYRTYPPKQLRKDLDFLLKKFESIHPDYFKEMSRDSVLKRYNTLKNSITQPMTRVEFMNLFTPVVFNVIKDGHNYVWGAEADLKSYTDKGGKLFPYPVEIRDKRLFINSASSDIPFNAEITAVNNVKSKEVIERILSQYNAESDNFEEILTSQWFSSSYWFNYGGFKEYKIEYRAGKDSPVSYKMVLGKTQFQIDSLRKKNNVQNYSFYELPEIKTMVFEYNVCDNLKDFRPFCDSLFNTIRQKDYKNLIIDIRTNTGGTTRLNDVLYEYITDKPVTQFEKIETKVSREKKKDFRYQNHRYAGWFKWYHYLYYPIYIRQNEKRKELLTAKNGTFIQQVFAPQKPKENPLRFTGNVYLLTSRKTYSAAACFAAGFKCYGIGPVIGQETGEPTAFTADFVPVTLPHTKLQAAISSKRFILACDKNDGRGVIPDYIIDNQSIQMQDLEMDFVKRLIQTKID